MKTELSKSLLILFNAHHNVMVKTSEMHYIIKLV